MGPGPPDPPTDLTDPHSAVLFLANRIIELTTNFTVVTPRLENFGPIRPMMTC